jgi:predicted nuclease of predicted toxin-antitoxin system
MKLLLDENLSRRLVPFLLNDYPDTTQVALLGMERASDREIWEYARANSFVIVTRDSDYYELSTLYGQPPKVIWLRTGNQVKAATVAALLNHRQTVEKALMIDDKACIEIY